MRTTIICCALLGVFALAGCKKKPGPAPAGKEPPPAAGKEAPEPASEPSPGNAALPADSAYAKGKVKAATMELMTMTEVPGANAGEIKDEALKKAAEASALNQALVVTGERGKLVFNTPGWYMPVGTEVRYDAKRKRYLLIDPGEQRYWGMGGSELGSFLEGGPVAARREYQVAFMPDAPAPQKVLGYETIVTEGELGFDWRVKLKSSEKSGRVRVRLTIMHTRDERLPKAWKETFIDFLTLPFQDKNGAETVAKIKARIGFPLSWQMEVINEGQKRQKGDQPPTIATRVIAMDLEEVERADLAFPPAGFHPSPEPYKLKADGQTVSDAVMGKLPARKGVAPEGVEPPGEEGKPVEDKPVEGKPVEGKKPPGADNKPPAKGK